MDTQKKAILSIVLSSILFGTIGILVRMIDTEIPPITQSLFRGAAALFLIALVSLPKNKEFFNITKKDIPYYFLAGVFGYGMMLAFFTLSVINTSIANTFFLLFTESFFVVIIAYFFERKNNKRSYHNFSVGFFGCFFHLQPAVIGQ